MLALGSMCVLLAVSGCDAGSADSKSSNYRIDGATASPGLAQINEDIDRLAKLLAMSMDDVRVRRLVYNGAAERFNGAPEILVKDIVDRKLADQSFRQLLVVKIAQSNRMSDVEAEAYLGRILRASDRLHIAVPVNFSSWNPDLYTPLVAAAPQGVKHDDILYIKSYDSKGNIVRLDRDEAPSLPVVVISLNERTDENGVVLAAYAPQDQSNSIDECIQTEDGGMDGIHCGGGGGGGGDGGTTTSFRQGSHQETLERVRVINDHEGWWDEPAEIWTVVSCSGSSSPVFKTRLGDPEPEDNWLHAGRNSRGAYDYRRSIDDLAVKGIYYFNWDTSIFGNNCRHEFYEDDGGGSTTISFNLKDEITGITTTITDTRPVQRAEMGFFPVLYSNSLSQPYGTSDIEIKMR